MNLPGQATLRSSRVKARQPAVVTRVEVELGLGARALLRQAARGPAAADNPGAAVRGVAERSLAVEGLLDSFFLHARAPDAVDRAAEPHALAPGRRLGAEVVEVLRELRRPWLAEGEVERGTVQGSPLRR